MPYSEEAFKELQRQRHLFSTIYFVVVVLAAAAMIVLFILVLNDRHNIQQQRFDAALRQCEDTNSRRAHTVRVLNRQIAKLPPAEKARAQTSERFTILLINALEPHRNCLIYAKSIVSSDLPKGVR